FCQEKAIENTSLIYIVMTKIILTGGPSSGKTTIINSLLEKGYSVVSEVAKDIIEKEGLVDPNNKKKYEELQNKIAHLQIKREKNLEGKVINFLDRGVYDGIVYCE